MGAPFRQIDVQRVIRAFAKEGVPVRVEIEPGGKIVALPAGMTRAQDGDDIDAEIQAAIDDED